MDGRGKALAAGAPPRRIVSLVPSSTETLFDLGVGERVVGITRFCVHPRERLEGVARVGGTKDVDVERLLALKPDLVLANVEENTREIVEALDPHVPVWAGFPRDVDEACADLAATADLVGADARPWLDRVAAARAALPAVPPWTFAYLVWRRPWMTASHGTFIAALLGEAGGRPVTDEPRYPRVDPPALARADRVLLSSEPFPFQEKHREELARLGVPVERIALVDGELLSWHGTRMVRGLTYLARLTRVPPPTGVDARKSRW